MSKTYFASASEVRKYLLQRGVTEKISVRRCHSPFSGDPYFTVYFPVPKGVVVISDGGSGTGTTYVSSDNNEVAKRLQEISNILRNTNAILTTKVVPS